MDIISYTEETYDMQDAHSGNGMGRMLLGRYTDAWLNFMSEAIEVQFEEPLIEGEEYVLEYHIKKSNNGFNSGTCVISSDEFSIYFFDDTINYYGDHEDAIKGKCLVESEPYVTEWGMIHGCL